MCTCTSSKELPTYFRTKIDTVQYLFPEVQHRYTYTYTYVYSCTRTSHVRVTYVYCINVYFGKYNVESTLYTFYCTRMYVYSCTRTSGSTKVLPYLKVRASVLVFVRYTYSTLYSTVRVHVRQTTRYLRRYSILFPEVQYIQ